MIDITHAKQEFKKYVSNYDPNNSRIALKISHILRVADNCKSIAESLNFSEEDVKLAELIGIFHDIGRFEQVRIANTFSDKESGINHGELSAKILFEDGLIRNYLDDTKYDNLIKNAIINHNKSEIDKSLTGRDLLFAKIIRDADKLDIFYNITFTEMEAIFWYKDFNCEKISDKVLNELLYDNKINYPDITNNADVITIFYAFIFDLYFDSTLDTLIEKKYLDLFTKRVLETFKSPTIHTQMKSVVALYQDYFAKHTNK